MAILGVDVGGTFTDAVLILDGRPFTAKAPTTPEDQTEGVLAAIRAVLEQGGCDPGDVESFAHGMTVGTNALLERRGARTALLTTAGFTDLLEVRRQNRPSLYHLCEGWPEPVVAREDRIGIDERCGPGGVEKDLTEAEVDRVVAALGGLDPESVAICLLHSYAEPAHERMVAEAVRERLPAVHVSASTEVLPRFREYERCSTTAVDAYLTPLLGRYLSNLTEAARAELLPEPTVMRSSGGVVDAQTAARSGAWSVLSGPAGGAVGAAMLAGQSGVGDVIGLDMGGTSTDVCVVRDGRVARTESRAIGGLPIQLPMVDVHTVGAGGGSIASLDAGGALQVGPRSAGAVPGPACYGHGGTEPTVTDANLLLGHLDPDGRLPGAIELDRDAAESALARLGERTGLDPIEAAQGVIRLANQEMARAVRVVTVERGLDPRRLALMPFGGAGPMHGAALAGELGIRRVICPRAGGVLSALGLSVSERRLDAAKTVMLSGEDLDSQAIAAEVEALLAPLRDQLAGEPEITYLIRYRGQSFELPVPGSPAPDPAELAASFAAEHERRYGYRDPEGEIELVDVLAAVRARGREVELEASASEPQRSRRPVRFGDEWAEAEVLAGAPPPGMELAGPAVVELPDATLVVPPGWSGGVDGAGTITITQGKP